MRALEIPLGDLMAIHVLMFHFRNFKK